MGQLASNYNIVHDCRYHVVWCPKYRRKVITSTDPRVDNPPIPGDPGPVDERLTTIIREVCVETGSTLIEMEVMSDHVHLLVQVDPQFGINRVVRLIKGRSSRLLRQEFPSLKRRLPTLWTNSYFVSTMGDANEVVIENYIKEQRNA